AFHSPVMANFWMHNGFLQVEGEKMAKSAGNFFTIRELLADWPGEVLRYQMLMTHYRQPIDWTRRNSEEAAAALDHFRTATAGVNGRAGEVEQEMIKALSDDLNTPLLVAGLHRLLDEARKGSQKAAVDLRATFR